MSYSKAEKLHQRWHKNKPALKGKVNIPSIGDLYREGAVHEIVYLSTKWTKSYDPQIKKLIKGVQVIDSLHAESNPQPFHHTFTKKDPPALWTDENDFEGQETVEIPELPDHMSCLGTLYGLRVIDPIRDPDCKKSTCRWGRGMLPLVLGSSENGYDRTLLIFYPAKNQIGVILGGRFRVTRRGIVG